MAVYTIPITKVLNRLEASELIEAIFGCESLIHYEQSVFESFIAYYNDEILQLEFGPQNERQSAKLALSTHGNLIEVVQVLGRNRNRTRPELRRLLSDSIFPNAGKQQLNRTIDVTLRLWLMINTRESQLKPSSRLHRPCLEWNDESTLSGFLSGSFPKPRWELSAREGRYDPRFTAAFMTKICGLKIGWTTSLEDHLRLDRRTKTLWVFPYKPFLQMLLQTDETSASLGLKQKTLIPCEILHETIQSLLLLFPEPDKETQTLLRAHRQTFHEYEPFESSRPLGILDFDYWRDRLLELHQEVFQVQCPSWNQLLRDQRDPQQWLTVWLALVLAALTLLSTIASIVAMAASLEQAWGSQSLQSCTCKTCESD